MKKTLVALTVAAFATSASALTVYENEGTKVDFDGSLRLLLDNSGSNTKVNGLKDEAKTKRRHTNLKNDGSRFGVRVKHDLAEDFFAFGRVEFRFNDDSAEKGVDGFGGLYAHRAYVGLGSKQYGELAFGRQVTIGDDIAQAGFDNTYGITKTPLTTSGKSVIRYDYKGIEGLHLGLDYRFAEKRDDRGEVAEPTYKNDELVGNLKSGYGAGAIYTFKLADTNSVTLATGYTRDNFATYNKDKHHRDSFAVGAKYTVNDLTLALDYGYQLEKFSGDEKKSFHGLAVGAKYQVTPEIAAYGNYVYLNGKYSVDGNTLEKEKSHRFMLGTEYKVHKNVFAFVEGSVQRTTTTPIPTLDLSKTRKTDKAIGVGLRVHW